MKALFTFLTIIFLVGLSAQSINLEASKMEWTGKKITGQHNGTIQIAEANFGYEDGQLVSGTIVIDMTSISCSDLSGEKAESLVGHLKSADFFDVVGFPEAELTFNSVKQVEGNSYQLSGELTIKGITEAISFYANIGEKEATTTLKIDRSKYDVRYGSTSFFDGLGDKAIDNIFEIKGKLVFQ